MRRDFLQFLFGDPSIEEKLDDPAVIENLITLYEEADHAEAELIKANKKPLASALKTLGVNASVEAFPQWCEIRFDDEVSYREACAAIFTPEAMHTLAEAGWIPAKSGDEAMSNEPPSLKLGFFEISTAGEDVSDKEKGPALKSVMKDGRENDTDEQERTDELNPVENPDAEMGEKAEGVGKASDGKDPEGKPKGSSKSESHSIDAVALAHKLLEMTSVTAIPVVGEPPLSASAKAGQRNRLDKLRRRRKTKAA